MNLLMQHWKIQQALIEFLAELNSPVTASKNSSSLFIVLSDSLREPLEHDPLLMLF